MVRYVAKPGKGIVEEIEEVEKEEIPTIELEEPKEILRKAMKKAWMRPELKPIRDKLSMLMEKEWKPQIEEALEKTGYAEELKRRAKAIGLGKKIEKIWE